MSLQPAFDVLSALTGQFEGDGRSVEHVEATASDTVPGALEVSLDVPLSLCEMGSEGAESAPTPTAATLTADGALEVAFDDAGHRLVPEFDPETVETRAVGVDVDGGALRLSLDVRIDPSEGTAGQSDGTGATELDAGGGDSRSPFDSDSAPTPADEDDAADADAAEDDPLSAQLAAARTPDVPAYDDVEYLQALYDDCENFIEMSERIEMDVSSETVRRYMIEAEIHDPKSYDTDAEPDASGPPAEEEGEPEGRPADATEPARPEEGATPSSPTQPEQSLTDEQLVTDGLGLPENVRIEDVADAVVESVTVYEVQTALGLDRERTQDLLEDLDLLDLVMRPLSGNPEEHVSYDEVAARIRECVPPRTDPPSPT